MSEDCYVEIEGAPETIDAMEKLQRRIPPLETWKDGTYRPPQSRFDLRTYFEVLTHITIAPDFEIDYYYYQEDSGAEPVLYARHKNDPPLDFFPTEDSKNKLGFWKPLPPEGALVPDSSYKSWFELVVFSRIASQFYLQWHASYKDFQFVASPEHVERIIKDERIPSETADKARKLDTRVIVDDDETDYVTVTYTGFSKWGGFSRVDDRISRRAPYISICKRKIRSSVDYSCGYLL